MVTAMATTPLETLKARLDLDQVEVVEQAEQLGWTLERVGKNWLWRNLEGETSTLAATDEEVVAGARAIVERSGVASRIISELEQVATLPDFQRLTGEHDLVDVEFDTRFTLTEQARIRYAMDEAAERLGASSVATQLASDEQPSTQTATPQGLAATLENEREIIPNSIPTETLVKELSLDLVNTDGGTQTRAALNLEVVEEYRAAMVAGTEFPPGVVFYDGSAYWLADGFHRHEGARLAGREFLPFEVRQGTRRDAVLYSVGANSSHGLRRTDADKRRAVETMLRDEEWSKWSNREIARQCVVTHTFVGGVREELTGTRSQREVTAKRGGTEYTVKTENIGGSPDVKATPADVAHSSTSDEEGNQATVDPSPVAPSTETEESASIVVNDRRRFADHAVAASPAAIAEKKPDKWTAIEKRLKGRALVVTHTFMPKGLGVQITVNIAGADPSDALNSNLFSAGEVTGLGEVEFELVAQRLDADTGKAEPVKKASVKKATAKTGSKKGWDKSPLNPANFKKGSRVRVRVDDREQNGEVVGVSSTDDRKLRVKVGSKTHEIFPAQLLPVKTGGGAKKAAKSATPIKVGDTVRVTDKSCTNTFGQRGEVGYHKGDTYRVKIAGHSYEYKAEQIVREKKTATRGATKKATTAGTVARKGKAEAHGNN